LIPLEASESIAFFGPSGIDPLLKFGHIAEGMNAIGSDRQVLRGTPTGAVAQDDSRRRYAFAQCLEV
jgi:hypothetical protein